MSYTPIDENIVDPAREIVRGIDSFIAAVNARAENQGAWDPAHLQALAEISSELQELRVRLARPVVAADCVVGTTAGRVPGDVQVGCGHQAKRRASLSRCRCHGPA